LIDFSGLVSHAPLEKTVAICGFRPRLQRRVRTGFAPVSLFGPQGHHHVVK
jgi:hypothetical protein